MSKLLNSPASITRLTTACLLPLMSIEATADQRYVFIGDSLVDNQNSYIATTLITPTNVIPATPPYFDGRFSNGPNWTDRLAPTQLYYMDYYFSNPECTTVNSSNGLASLCGTTVDPGTQPGLSLSFAFGGSEAGTAQLPTAAPGMISVLNDLASYNDANVVANLNGATFAFLTGGNDYTNYVFTGGDGVSEQAIVNQTLGYIGQGLEMAAEMGARRAIVLNLFDLARVPSLGEYFNASQLAQSGRLSTLHNAGLSGTIAAATQNTGLDIILVDLNGLYEDIYAHPSRYGFTNTTSGCITSDANHTATGECPDAASENATLYWDGQHPTTKAHDYIYQLTNATLGAVDEDGGWLASLADAALLPLRSLNASIRNHFTDHPSNHSPTISQQSDSNKTLFVQLEGGRGKRDNHGDFPGYNYDMNNLIIGLSYATGEIDDNLRVGAHLSYSGLDANITGGGEFDNQSAGIGLFAVHQHNNLSLGIQTNLMHYEIENIHRNTRFSVLPEAHGKTDGWGITLETQATLSHEFERVSTPGGLAISGRLSASRVRIDGYNESDAEFLNLNVEGSDLSEALAGIEIATWKTFHTSAGTVQTDISLAYDYDLLNKKRKADARLPSGQAIHASSSVAERGQINLEGSVQLIKKENLNISLTLDATFNNSWKYRQFIPRISVAKVF
jgi:outer membrane lipase/esterase